jgi:hypothetical protein
MRVNSTPSLRTDFELETPTFDAMLQRDAGMRTGNVTPVGFGRQAAS